MFSLLLVSLSVTLVSSQTHYPGYGYGGYGGYGSYGGYGMMGWDDLYNSAQVKAFQPAAPAASVAPAYSPRVTLPAQVKAIQPIQPAAPAASVAPAYSPRVTLPAQVKAIQPIQPAAPAVKVASPSPQADSEPQVNWQIYAQKALNAPLAVQSRLSDAKSPAAKAALSYLKNALDIDSCGQTAKVYIETILSGGSPAQANAEATGVYIRNYNAGERPAPGSPCEASDIAFRQAAEDGQDPVLAAALAFMKSYGSDSPCFVSSRDYVEAIIAGSAHTDAGLAAAKSFARQIQILAAQGKKTVDPVCTAAAQAYASTSDVPSSPSAAAMQAFISKALETGTGFDPVCYSAAERFFDSYESGKPELISTFAAARDFLRFYKYSPSPAAQSPCAAATKAYAAAIKNSPSAPNTQALFAFVDEAVLSNDDGLDPVCGASADAYFDAYLSGDGESAATEAAAVAYLNAVESNPNFNLESPCGRAAQAYIGTF